MQNPEVYELTNPQKSIWFTEQYYKGTTVNNICGSVLIEQNVNIDILNKAINKFIENNDSFRTRLKLINGNVYQYFTDHTTYDFEFINLNESSEIETYAKQMVSTPFEMIDSKLFNFKLFTLANGYGGFIVNAHHIISDAATFSFIATEVTSNYSILLKNEPIPKKEYSYIDYIKSEKDYLNSNRFEKDKSYWNELLSTLPEPATIPTLKNNEPDSCEADRKECIFDPAYMKKINAFCKNYNISIYNFLIAIYSLYIGRANNLSNFLIGTPILNRTTYAEKHTSGMYISTSILNININNDLTFAEFSQEIAKSTMSLLRHQKYNYQYIIDDLRKKDKSIPNLYNVMLSYQITKATDLNSEIQYESKWYANNCISNDIDIHFHDNDNTGNLLVEYDYKKCKYTNKDMEDIHKRILHIINQILSNENTNLKDIEIVTEEEKEELIYSFNSTEIEIPSNINIIDLFKVQVKNNPNKIAITYENQSITYYELDQKSSQIANMLLENKISLGNIVAILLPKSIEFFISIIGILKVGAIYIPIDINFPDNRINYIMSDSKPSLCITNSFQKNRISNTQTIDFYECNNFDNVFDKKINIHEDTGCYIIYTSGTTGNPKGIVATHKNVVNYTYSFQHEFKLSSSKDTVLQQFTPSFDAFVEEFYPALLNGIKIFSVSKDTTLDLNKLENYIKENNVTLISCAPLLLNELNKLKVLPSVHTFISGGDILKKSFFSNLIKYANVYNTYGPTETTVCSTYHKCTTEENNSIPIGKTIANYKNYILSDNNRLLPKGTIGELCIGGNGVTLGYLNNPNLTNEKFITLPFINERVYKTGDLCRINTNNEIEFIGRKDCQLKINGYRISLNEIEKMINQYPSIKNCIVIDFKDNSDIKKLCAYYIGSNTITTKELHEYLIKVMPHYMIPSIFIRIDSIPTNINGKIDKKQLPNPLDFYKNKSSEYVAPISPLEKDLVDIWEKILNIKKLSITDNLFDLGADSISIIQFQSYIADKNIHINVQDLYKNPSIRELAEQIEKNSFRNINVTKYQEININNLNINQPHKPEINNVLITGVTGFLGIHILNYLLNNYKCKIYCLVRGKDLKFAINRLKTLYKFYFNKNLFFDDKISILQGDISKEYLGLSLNEYSNLCDNIDTVIHSAATVKHYGNESIFEEFNIFGTKNIIQFCLDSNSQLHHISTISVSGERTYNASDTYFTEKDFWINQDYYKNIYVKSKFEAEYCIYKAITEKNLYAKIYRVGNLTGRYTDGQFQKNIETNSFYKTLKNIIELHKVPSSVKNFSIDLTPVDLASEAISKLVLNNRTSNIVYHIYNNIISIQQLINMLNDLGLDITIYDIPQTKEEKSFTNSLSHNTTFDENTSSIILSNDITNNYLNQIDFNWSIVDKEYLNKLINYMKKSNYLSKE